MIWISHRANLNGPNTATYGENHPKSIEELLQTYSDDNFACEVDVWWYKDVFYLGHDKPEYAITKNFLFDRRIFVHCKNIEALYFLKIEETTSIKAFFHQQDDVVQISNSQYLWSYPRANIILTPKSIAVLPELVKDWAGLDKCAGVCSDNIIELQKNINYKI